MSREVVFTVVACFLWFGGLETGNLRDCLGTQFCWNNSISSKSEWDGRQQHCVLVSTVHFHCHRVNAEKEDSVIKSGKIRKRRKLGVAEEEKGSYRHLVERLINCETLKNEWNVKYKIWNEAKIWGGTKVEECICMLLGHYWEPQKTKTISSCHAKTNATASEIIHLVEYIIMLSQDFLKVFLRKFEYS